IKPDSAQAILLSVFFGMGLVLLTWLQKQPNAAQAGLTRFLFGQASTLLMGDFLTLLCLIFPVLIVVIAFWKEFKIVCFDRPYAVSIGLPVFWLEQLTLVLQEKCSPSRLLQHRLMRLLRLRTPDSAMRTTLLGITDAIRNARSWSTSKVTRSRWFTPIISTPRSSERSTSSSSWVSIRTSMPTSRATPTMSAISAAERTAAINSTQSAPPDEGARHRQAIAIRCDHRRGVP
ncbi:MAG: hypothetical protein EBY96_05105, partial [Actinobacteria bacterium]|nr:hypothetical protein [Actinomycetota bacterium]